MRKFILSALSIIAVGVLSCGQPKDISAGKAESGQATEGSQNNENVQVSESEVAAALEYLSSDELQGRETGTDGIEKAAVYIENVFKENGIEPYFETYRDSFEIEGTTGYNIVGLKEGSHPELKNEYLIIGAHYDHVGKAKAVGDDILANGANDNASGTTAVLELAKYLSGVDTKRSILFTLYSAEEMGLKGSAHLAQRLKNENLDLYVMFNIEMVGVPLNDKEYLAYLTGYDLSNLAEKFNEYSGEEVLGFLPQAKEYQLFRRSDNYPFYSEFQVPAQTISTFDFTNYDYYHHVDDEYERMNVAFMVDLIKDIIPGVTSMANSETREIKMNE